MSHECRGSTSGLECPKCSRHTVIALNINVWKCLSCDFSKDFSKEKEDKKSDNTNLLTVLGGFAIAALFLLGI